MRYIFLFAFMLMCAFSLAGVITSNYSLEMSIAFFIAATCSLVALAATSIVDMFINRAG